MLRQIKFFFAGIACLLFQGTLFAGLTITPSRTEISVPPGGSFQGTYSVRNDYGTPTDIKVEFRNWFISQDNKGIAASDWLSVSPNELYLQPGESRDISYEVRVSTAAKGLLVAMISFVPQTQEEQGVSLVISVSLFTVVQGTEKLDWEISDIRLGGKADNIQASALVTDKGNIHLRPTGTITVTSRGKEMLVMDFVEGRPVYPGMSRTIVAKNRSGTVLGKGKYTAIVTVKCYDQEKSKKISFEVTPSGDITTK